MKIIVTGGAGFIGSALVRHLIGHTDHEVLVVDKLTYAGNLASLAAVEGHPRYRFSRTDICDRAGDRRALRELRPRRGDASRGRKPCRPLDRRRRPTSSTPTSSAPTCCSRPRWRIGASSARAQAISASTTSRPTRSTARSADDGTLHRGDRATIRARPIPPPRPRPTIWCAPGATPTGCRSCSPTARTITGPYQFPEKLIPLMIIKALAGEPMPVYGHGVNVRDWLYVDDHAEALTLVLERGRVGETYNIGGDAERRNIDVVGAICDAHRPARPAPTAASHRDLITFVTDRPGHDFRYAIDCSQAERASSAGRPGTPSRPASPRPCTGTSTTAPGGSRCSPRTMPTHPPRPRHEKRLSECGSSCSAARARSAREFRALDRRRRTSRWSPRPQRARSRPTPLRSRD